LPAIELDDLIPYLGLVHLPLGDALCKEGEQLPYAYFPTSAIISIHHILENGASPEIASVGREGVFGVSLFMGGEGTRSWATVTMAGYGYRIKPALLLQKFNSGGLLQRLLLRYSHALVTESDQNVVCSRHHQVEQRLCLAVSCGYCYYNRLRHI
jgi:CRP-like cAMP-binding protein